jgi:hypothetical protein
MRVAVKDACVLIDLANGGLLEAWFRLDIETHTTDLVLRQVRRDEQWQRVSGFVEAGWLKVTTLSGEQVEAMCEEFAGLPIGVEDQSVLFVAMQMEDAILLTGDRRLRIEGLRRELEVKGVLWVLDQVVEKGVMSPALAAEKLRLILDSGSYLPLEECEARFRRWIPKTPGV